jgi:hypothetical protein
MSNFKNRAQIITKARQVTHSTLRQHAILLELLELPQLMDTCVKVCLFANQLNK